MDDPNETGGPLGSSSFFGRFSAGHCDMDNIAFSPSSSDFRPYLYVPIRKTSLKTSNQPSESVGINSDLPAERRNSRKESIAYSPKRKLSNLTASNHQSFDNLQQLMKDNQHDGMFSGDFDDNNHVTQSLPASPLSTPQGSPKPAHHQFTNKKISADEIHCSIPWYYTGFIAAHSATENSSPLICTTEKQSENKELQTLGKTTEFFSGISVNPKFPVTSGQFGRQRKFNITNRDMNFLAPTSM